MDQEGWKNRPALNKYRRLIMPGYQPGIPTGSIPLNVDYQNLQTNFQQLDTQFGIDHVPFSTTTPAIEGYHQSIHLNPVSTTATNPPNNQPVDPPADTAGFGQLFSSEIDDGVNTDTALYFLTGSTPGKLIQLTRNFKPILGDNGCTFLPGGLILQWGQITSTASSFQTLTFSANANNIAFPNNCYAVYTQPYGSGSVPGSQATVDIRKSTLSNLSFEWVFVTNSGSYTGFFWAAIGN